MAFVTSRQGSGLSVSYPALPGDHVIAVVVSHGPVAVGVLAEFNAGWRWVGSKNAAGYTRSIDIYYRVEPAGPTTAYPAAVPGRFAHVRYGTITATQTTVLVYRGGALARWAQLEDFTERPRFPGLPGGAGPGDVIRIGMATYPVGGIVPSGDTQRAYDAATYMYEVGDRLSYPLPIPETLSRGTSSGRAWNTWTIVLGPRPVEVPRVTAPSLADASQPVEISWQPIEGQTARSIVRIADGDPQYLTSTGVWVASEQWLTGNANVQMLPSMGAPYEWLIAVAARAGDDISAWSEAVYLQTVQPPGAPTSLSVSSWTIRRPVIQASGPSGQIVGYRYEVLVGGVLHESGQAGPGVGWQPVRMPDGPVTVTAAAIVTGGITGAARTVTGTVSVPPVPVPEVVAVAVIHPDSGLPGVRLVITAPGVWGLEVQPTGGHLLTGSIVDGTTVDDYNPTTAYQLRLLDEARDPVEASVWVIVDRLTVYDPPSVAPMSTQQEAQAGWLIDPLRPELALRLSAREDGGLRYDPSAERTRYRGQSHETVSYRDRMAFLGGTSTLWFRGRGDYEGLLRLLEAQTPLRYRWIPSSDGTTGRVDEMLIDSVDLPRLLPGVNHDTWVCTIGWGPYIREDN